MNTLEMREVLHLDISRHSLPFVYEVRVGENDDIREVLIDGRDRQDNDGFEHVAVRPRLRNEHAEICRRALEF